MNNFNAIYIYDLHGNAKKKERAFDGSKDENVFDIQQGVSIAIFIKLKDKDPCIRSIILRYLGHDHINTINYILMIFHQPVGLN
jgi:predicted helicase